MRTARTGMSDEDRLHACTVECLQESQGHQAKRSPISGCERVHPRVLPLVDHGRPRQYAQSAPIRLQRTHHRQAPDSVARPPPRAQRRDAPEPSAPPPHSAIRPLFRGCRARQLRGVMFRLRSPRVTVLCCARPDMFLQLKSAPSFHREST